MAGDRLTRLLTCTSVLCARRSTCRLVLHVRRWPSREASSARRRAFEFGRSTMLVRLVLRFLVAYCDVSELGSGQPSTVVDVDSCSALTRSCAEHTDLASCAGRTFNSWPWELYMGSVPWDLAGICDRSLFRSIATRVKIGSVCYTYSAVEAVRRTECTVPP